MHTYVYLLLIVTLMSFSSRSIAAEPNAEGVCLAGTDLSHIQVKGICSKDYEDKNFKVAFTSWMSAADAGNTNAPFNIGQAYRRGHGVSKSYEEAFKWYEVGAKRGDSHSMNNAAMSAKTGLGTRRDYAVAFKWWKVAAEMGSTNAQHSLGTAHANGLPGVIGKDLRRGYMWWSIALKNGREKSRKNRDKSRIHLGPKKLAESEQLIIECEKKKYKDC